MTSSTFPAILEWMDKNPGPSPMLDQMISGALGVVTEVRVHPAAGMPQTIVPPFSTSLEWAKRGVPEGWVWSLNPSDDGYTAMVKPMREATVGARLPRMYEGSAPIDQPELALIRAWVKARCP